MGLTPPQEVSGALAHGGLFAGVDGMSTAQTQTLRRDRTRGASAPARKDPHVNPGTVSQIPFLTGPEDRLLLNEDPITLSLIHI